MVQLLKVARPSQVAADHSYTTTMQACDTRQVLDLPNELMTSSPIKHRQDLGGSLTSPRVSLDHNISASSFCDLDDMDRAADISWHPSDRDNVSGSSDYEDEPLSYNLEYDVSNNNIVEETKILVFANHLDTLVHCTTCQLLGGKIVDFELVQVTQTGTSQSMEKYGFCKVFGRLIATQVNVATVVTDRHVGIGARMRAEYTPKGINHQFDVYHIVNRFRKKLNEICKKKKYKSVVPWVRSILNHAWYISRNCDGNPDKLVELFSSIAYHISDKHKWEGNKFINRCLHAALSREEQKSKLWLKGQSL
ncbi:hypothetical protein LSH36_296g04058 [Paralvinella palmiformis]|uniref:Mutator-like transposase domain-containing protein n=1 Tax=Paralvinella palmiformis TaxID=53620 RepID=A0AAD9N2W4_9ANNE|nr:hypothetical protein LSH36_296g04058 [Paralvinella palmiformis]